MKPLQTLNKVNKTYLVLAIFAVLIAVFYGATLQNGFVYDDKQQVQENRYVQSLRYLPKVVTGCTWEYAFGQCKDRALYYRPVQSLSYLLTYQISSAPWVFHLANLLYFLAVVFLIFLLAKALGFHDLFAFVAALLFLVHPINSEAVNWIAAVPDLTLALFALLSTIFFISHRKAASSQSFLTKKLVFAYLFYFFALLAKEPAALLPVAFLFLDVAFFKKKIADFFAWKELRIYLGFALLLAVSLAMRVMVLGSLAPQGATPFVTFSLGERIASGSHLFAQYLGKLFFPHPLLFFYSFGKKSDFFSFEFLGALVSLAAFFAIAIFLFKKARVAAVFSLFWILLFLAPVLVFLESLGESVFAERYLFLPAIGFSLAVSSVLFSVWKNAGTPGKILLALALCAAALASFAIVQERNKDFRNNEALYLKTLSQNPRAYPIRFNWAVYLRSEQGDFEAAKQEFETLVRQNPNWGDTGMVYLHLGDYYRDAKQDSARALAYYEKSAAASGNIWKAHFAYDRIGGLFAAQEEYLKALPYFCKAVQIYPEARDAGARFDRTVSLVTSAYEDEPSAFLEDVKEAFGKAEREGVRYGRTRCDGKSCSHFFSLRLEQESEIILPFLIAAVDDSGKRVEITNSAFNPATAEAMLQTDASWQDTKLAFMFPTCEGMYYEATTK